MAQYKVIQDIEAEDKLLGPLSLRQFIYAAIAAVSLYLSALSVIKGVYFFLIILLPPAIFCIFFAWPWSQNQPTEVWALAHLRFLFKPRKRIWDQMGVKNMVTITAPKKIEKVYTNGLSETEVKSRLNALADTIDSRGWAIKNLNVNVAVQTPTYDPAASDRLVTATMPQPVPDLDVQASDDILDAQNNPVAHQFDQMINASTQTHRQQILDKMRDAGATTPQPSQPTATQPPASYWFMNQPGSTTNSTPAVGAGSPIIDASALQPPVPVAATPTADEQAFAAQLVQQNSAQQAQNMHMHTINPLSSSDDAQSMQAPIQNPIPAAITPPIPDVPVSQPAMTTPADAAILNLANNNDLNVATIARQAHKARDPEPPEDEVVISLR